MVVSLVWLTICPFLQAVTPAPDGGYLGANTAEGDFALNALTTGVQNTAIGYAALLNNTTGYNNTATGFNALSINTAGIENTATGVAALGANRTGRDNTATGFGALETNETGNNNTATGFQALFNNVYGADNTATGFNALSNNETGADNTATGVDALLSNMTGNSNTATGSNALQLNTTGSNNTATGLSALFSNTSGKNNTACGISALALNTSGHDNVADGFEALFRNTGSSNIALGSNAGINLTTGSNNIDIGAPGVAGEAKKIRIGKQGTQNGTFIAGIHGVAITGSTVTVNSNGQLGVAPSSARFKDEIKPMDKASEAILSLKPVTFHYKKEIDAECTPQFGLVAEDVEKVNPDLVVKDADGKVYTVRYEAVNAMLLNEFLKEHRKVEELQAIVAKQEATNSRQQQQIEVLTAGLQTVTARVESNQPDARVVSGN